MRFSMPEKTQAWAISRMGGEGAGWWLGSLLNEEISVAASTGENTLTGQMMDIVILRSSD